MRTQLFVLEGSFREYKQIFLQNSDIFLTGICPDSSFLTRRIYNENLSSRIREFLTSVTMHYFVLICFFKMASADLVVQTSNGAVQGKTSMAGDVEAFLGIPYAEPPIGELRFAKPVPKKMWTEILDASELSPPCTQLSLNDSYYFTPDVTNMSEDCLYLNIWTPRPVINDALKPVVIFIHGGGFMAGTSSINLLDGANLASRGNNVVVNFNYRVGSIGYFLAFIKEADGNMGMYDQVMAIGWVKENAMHFGGDPENIVLMGQSAGAQSVAAHMLSPLSENLFNKAIIQSGSMIIPSYFDNNTRLFRNSEALASTTGCSNETVNLNTDPHSVVNCLKRQTVKSILMAERSLIFKSPFLFFPRINDKFLPKIAIKLLREGKFNKDVSVLTGIVNDEATLFIAAGLPMISPDHFGRYGYNFPQSISKSFVKIILRQLIIIANASVPSEVTDFYLNRVKNRTSEGYIKMFAEVGGDYTLACNTIFQADFISLKGNPVYFYKFGFRAASTPMAEWVGVSHGDELQYIFGNPFHKNLTKEEVDLSHQLMDRWSAFARTGDPNLPGQLPWLRYSYHKPYYLSIGQNEESIHMRPLDRCKIWRKTFDSDIPTQT